MKPIEECNMTNGGQHLWLPVENKSGKGMQCYSCPMCAQKIYWSSVTQRWVNVTGATTELGTAASTGSDAAAGVDQNATITGATQKAKEV